MALAFRMETVSTLTQMQSDGNNFFLHETKLSIGEYTNSHAVNSIGTDNGNEMQTFTSVCRAKMVWKKSIKEQILVWLEIGYENV